MGHDKPCECANKLRSDMAGAIGDALREDFAGMLTSASRDLESLRVSVLSIFKKQLEAIQRMEKRVVALEGHVYELSAKMDEAQAVNVKYGNIHPRVTLKENHEALQSFRGKAL